MILESMSFGAITVSVMALTGITVEVIKRTINVSNNFLPAVSILSATVLTFMVNFAQSGLSVVKDNWVAYLLYGLFVGASTSGVYDNLKKPYEAVKNKLAQKKNEKIEDDKVNDYLNNLTNRDER